MSKLTVNSSANDMRAVHHMAVASCVAPPGEREVDAIAQESKESPPNTSIWSHNPYKMIRVNEEIPSLHETLAGDHCLTEFRCLNKRRRRPHTHKISRAYGSFGGAESGRSMPLTFMVWETGTAARIYVRRPSCQFRL